MELPRVFVTGTEVATFLHSALREPSAVDDRRLFENRLRYKHHQNRLLVNAGVACREAPVVAFRCNWMRIMADLAPLLYGTEVG
jgi:hypothetical protein